MDWELKMTKEVTRFENQKNGCTTQGIERFLRERLELSEVLVKVRTEKKLSEIKRGTQTESFTML